MAVFSVSGLVIFGLILIGVRYILNGGILDRNCSDIRVSLKGKTVIITGGTSGIGKETAIDLARRGARVIITSRNPVKAEGAITEIQRRLGNKNVYCKQLELSDQDSVTKFAEEFLQEEPRLDILINNAGMLDVKIQQSTSAKDGYDKMFAANYLGHFQLTILLLDRLKKCAPSRIVNVSSLLHIFVTSNAMFSALKDCKRNKYAGFSGYNISKLCLVLLTRELARQLEGTNVTTYSVHPGSVFTKMATSISWLAIPFVWSVSRSPEAGAQTTIYCALEESITHLSGSYFNNCRVARESSVARDHVLAKKLWEASYHATGIELK